MYNSQHFNYFALWLKGLSSLVRSYYNSLKLGRREEKNTVVVNGSLEENRFGKYTF